MDFGYEDEVAFPVQLTAASSLNPGPIHLDAMIDWLVCREVCIPGKAHLGLDLTVDPAATAAQPLGLGEALSLIPKPLPAGAKFTVTGGQTDFALTLTTGKRETYAEFLSARRRRRRPRWRARACPSAAVSGAARHRGRSRR